MFTYADLTACPRCRATMPQGSGSCPSCSADLASGPAYDVFRALQNVDHLVARLHDVAPAVATRSAPAAPAEPLPATAWAPQIPLTRDTPHPVLSGLTVPKFLLGLGALCLMVAALVFLVVAWQDLGVAGRTVVLVAFTLIAGSLAAWSARKGLRAGAESLTTVALGLLLLDLAGARTSGWFGDLGEAGFAVLAGGVIAAAAVAGALAVRRTQEPTLISAEIAAVLGIAAIDTGLGGLIGADWTAPAPWATAALAVSVAAAALTTPARLRTSTIGIATLAAFSWLALALTGLYRLIANPSWAELGHNFQVWPLLLAAAAVGAVAAVRQVPMTGRVNAAAASIALLSALPLGPVIDEDAHVITAALVCLVIAHAAAAWRLPRPWTWITSVPTGLAGGGLALTALVFTGFAISRLSDHGLWSGAASSRLPSIEDGTTWTFLLPVTVGAAALAGAAIRRCLGSNPKGLLVPAAAATIAAASLSPALSALPFAAVAAGLVIGTAVLVTLALRASTLTDRTVAGGLACLTGILAVGASLVDDGVTIAVLSILVAAVVAAEVRGSEALREAARWSLPLAAAALVWSIAAMAEVPLEWRATPVIAVLAALAVLRPSDGHEVSGLTAALFATAFSAAPLIAGDAYSDPRTAAAHLAAIAGVAGIIALLRKQEMAALAALTLFPFAALIGWSDPATAVAILALFAAVAIAIEVRRVGTALPAWLMARASVPVAVGGLIWTLAQLAIEHRLVTGGAWTALPVVLALGALIVWRPEAEREIPAALVAALAVAASLPAPLGADQNWLAMYLTLGGVTATASSLIHASRRRLAWAGLAFFSLAQWLRLEEIGVDTVEAYTLPLAIVLLAVGTRAFLTGDRSSLRTQGAGLGLALVPTLLQVLVEPIGLRAVLLGAASLLLIGVGVRQRWAAPLLAGGGSIALIVLRQATHATVLPQWALIGIAGVALVTLGLTWESRLADVRRAAGYVRGLR
jgi:hypothetical protein